MTEVTAATVECDLVEPGLGRLTTFGWVASGVFGLKSYVGDDGVRYCVCLLLISSAEHVCGQRENRNTVRALNKGTPHFQIYLIR